jgi:predicted O-methyltransferase YrrM
MNLARLAGPIRAHPYLRYAARCLLRGQHGAVVGRAFEAPDWDLYRMDVRRPFERLESIEREERVVGRALAALRDAGILANADYDARKFLAMRNAVKDAFEIPWTAITPRAQRLIYAINAIHRPGVMIAAGVFCGYTFICNAGAAAGPGAVYSARALVGLEIDPAEAARAEHNVRRIDPAGIAHIVAEDAVAFCAAWRESVDLLYLDVEDKHGRGKDLYLNIALQTWEKMPRGALLLAHNSVNSATELKGYLAYVRDTSNCRASMNVVLDGEGLEVSMK